MSGPGVDILAAMPPNVFGIADLARRYGVGEQSMRDWRKRVVPGRPVFPAGEIVNEGETKGTWVVRREELEPWEQRMRELGFPLPGERRGRGTPAAGD